MCPGTYRTEILCQESQSLRAAIRELEGEADSEFERISKLHRSLARILPRTAGFPEIAEGLRNLLEQLDKRKTQAVP